MCKTITQTVESTNVNSKQIEVQPFPSLMPNINSGIILVTACMTNLFM